jgi:spore germination protein YaaH
MMDVKNVWARQGPQLVKKIFLLVVGLIGLISSTLFSIWYFSDVPIISPLSSLTTFRFINQATPGSENKIVYGFLPYWNLDEAKLEPELTHLAYFGLTIGADGNIVTVLDGGSEPGYRHLKSDKFLDLTTTMLEQNKHVEIVLSQFNNDDIVALLNNPQAVKNLIQSLDSILLAYPIDGVNLDIEYTGEVNDSLRAGFVKLVTVIGSHIEKKYSTVQFSVDMYASAASRYQLWDVAKIAPHVDKIIVMAYDFHRRSSPQAGPVAPLFGGKQYWDSDINQHLADFVKVVPKEKLLLGIPFYGYEWQTTSRDPQAHTFPETGSTASIKRVKKLLAQANTLQVQQHWNEDALSPYLSYVKDGEIFVVYYENSRSLSYKLDYVNQLDLGGIAIWALGYEDESRELWDVIERKL